MRCFIFLLTAPAWAHVVSMSTGELTVDGPLATYELRMPMYEIAHIANPETLLDHIRFGDAHRTSAKCHPEEGTYVCMANYEFPGLIDRLQIDCTYFQVTVPNHVHVLRAVQGLNSDQVVFDRTISREEVRFRPPSRFELMTRDAIAGISRAIVSPAALFLLILAIAARSRFEAALLIAMYIAGEWLIRPLAPRIPWQFSPKFIEAAMALTVAYLAVEILTLPNAGKRWLIVLALGLFHGLYFAAFPATYLSGAAMIQAVLIGTLAAITMRWFTPIVHRVSTAILLIAGLGWFGWRVIRP